MLLAEAVHNPKDRVGIEIVVQRTSFYLVQEIFQDDKSSCPPAAGAVANDAGAVGFERECGEVD